MTQPSPRLLIVATVAPTLRAFLLPFAQHLRAQGWWVDALAQGVTDCPDCRRAFDQVWEVNWSRNPLDPRNLIATPQFIHELVVQQGYDLVHVHTPVAAFVTRFALRDLRRRGKLKLVYTAHGFHFHPQASRLKNVIFMGLEKLAATWTDDLVVINRVDEQAAKQQRLLPPEHIHYMPGIGVDLDVYNPARVSEVAIAEFRQELGLQPDNTLFLAIAEFIPRKRHHDILQALARLANPNVQLALAGDGPLLEPMQQLAEQLGIGSQVHFLGQRNDIPRLIRAAAATILVSGQEGLPRSVLESLALATPVIGTEIRGIQELLADGCGCLVPVGSIEGIAQAMTWMVDHPVEVAAMGQHGQERMNLYSLSQVLKLHDGLYNRVLGQRESLKALT